MDKKTVYIETSIVSYLTARPSSDLLAAAWQKVSLDWWDTQRDRLYVRLKNSWGYMKMADEIIKELWKIKDGIANEYGCDVKALVAYLRAKKSEGDKQVVDLRSMKRTAEQGAQADSQ